MQRIIPVALVILTFCSSLMAVNEEAKKKVNALMDAARTGKRSVLEKRAHEVVACGDPAVSMILENLGSRSVEEIVWGVRCLKVMKAKGVSETLRALCDHPKSAVRCEAVIAAGVLVGPEMADTFVAKSRDKNLHVRRRAIDALLAHAAATAQAREVALDGLTENDFWIASKSIRILAQTPVARKKGEVDALEVGVRARVSKLSKSAAHRVFPLLARRLGRGLESLALHALEHGSHQARLAVYRVSGKLKLKALIKPTIATLSRTAIDKEQVELVKAAVGFLGQLRDKDAVPVLIDVMARCRDEALKSDAAVSLRQITGQTFGYDEARWRDYARTL